MSTLVFVPVTPEQAMGLWQGESLHQVQAFAVTPGLLDTLDHPGDQEDAEYGCLVLASIWSLARTGRRLVLVGQAEDSSVRPGQETANGGVLLAGLSRRQVTSFFTDPVGDELSAHAATAVRGMTLDEAWEITEVQRLIREGDLLWHAVTELAHLGEDV